MKMNVYTHTTLDLPRLLLLADSIQGYVRRLETLGTWREVLQRNATTTDRSMPALLRDIQAWHAAGVQNDVGFFLVCLMGEAYARQVFDSDPELNALFAKTRAFEKRKGLREFEHFHLDDPDAPADWKALMVRLDRRYDEIEKISDERLCSWLRRHGEIEMADLFQNDRSAYDRCRESGRSQMYDTPRNAGAGHRGGQVEEDHR
jgi:hypothetical protein